ncbi:MAG: LuxR family transcriptional regulator [Pseudooceanicola sp.]|nr:LuxR family transcriptional regulator [Pseudooceanicola sp.]
MTVLPTGPGGRRALSLAVLILLQAACAAFFLGDVLIDFEATAANDLAHVWVEGVVSLALVAAIVLQLIELRHVMQRTERAEQGIRAARGEMQALIGQFFDDWALTPAERDVALLVLKGIDNEGIAALRGTAAGTVRAQTAAVYGKAGVDGRAQLLSLFMEELFADDSPDDRAPTARTGSGNG